MDLKSPLYAADISKGQFSVYLSWPKTAVPLSLQHQFCSKETAYCSDTKRLAGTHSWDRGRVQHHSFWQLLHPPLG